MLILSRKTGETVVIDGRIRVKVVRVEGDVVKLGIEAPADVPVHRQEIYEEIQKNNQEAVVGSFTACSHENGSSSSEVSKANSFTFSNPSSPEGNWSGVVFAAALLALLASPLLICGPF